MNYDIGNDYLGGILMVICIMGESCTGKSTAADYIKKETGAKIFTGKDYLKLAKNEDEAKKTFRSLLESHVSETQGVIFVVSEKEDLILVPENALKILFTADINVIKERFKERMHGNLVPPVEKMLERKAGLFSDVQHDLVIESDQISKEEMNEKLKSFLSERNKI
jgi:cytidylate kinase